jgi:hypothetical protein
MEQRNERCDTRREKIIHEFDIELQSLLVYGVIAAAERYDSRPGDGEAVCFGSSEFQQVDIFGGAIVGVACYITGTAVCDLAGRFAERVPD